MQQDIERLTDTLRHVSSLSGIGSKYASGKFGITKDRNLVYVYNNESGNVIATVKQVNGATTLRVRRASRYSNFLMNYNGFINTRHVYSVNLAKRSRWVRSQLVGYIESVSGNADREENTIVVENIFDNRVTVTDLSGRFTRNEVEIMSRVIRRHGFNNLPETVPETSFIRMYERVLGYFGTSIQTSPFYGGENERILS